MVNRVVPREELLVEAFRIARTIAVMDSGAVRLTKEAINRAADIMGLAQALEAGVDLAVQVETLDTPERREFDAIRRRDGPKAALAWRDARFAGRRPTQMALMAAMLARPRRPAVHLRAPGLPGAASVARSAQGRGCGAPPPRA